jgi:hypothetical protein
MSLHLLYFIILFDISLPKSCIDNTTPEYYMGGEAKCPEWTTTLTILVGKVVRPRWFRPATQPAPTPQQRSRPAATTRNSSDETTERRTIPNDSNTESFAGGYRDNLN